MKYIKKYNKFIIVLLFALFLIMCMTIEKITHPEDPKVNSRIEIGVDIKLVNENDANTKLIFAVLAPKMWNISENAELTFSTNNYSKGDVTNEAMTLVPNTDMEPSTALDWPTALQSEIGLMGNFGPVEWVVFESQTKFNYLDQELIGDAKTMKANVKIKLTTGDKNIKLFMGYIFMGKEHGMDSEYFKNNAQSKVLTVTGGSNALIDFTAVSLVSVSPSVYGWGDIFAINFETKVDELETDLYGSDQVYLQGKVIYSNGAVNKIVDVISEKTLMENISETSWQKYIYPKKFFDLPDNAVIDKAYFYFTNKDKSIIVRDPSGDDFLIQENCN